MLGVISDQWNFLHGSKTTSLTLVIQHKVEDEFEELATICLCWFCLKSQYCKNAFGFSGTLSSLISDLKEELEQLIVQLVLDRVLVSPP